MCSELAQKSQATVPFQRTRIAIKKAAEPRVQRKWPSLSEVRQYANQ
jgi:hypothetical protein